MNARESLSAAASTVDGVNCSSYFRQSTKPGDATVLFIRLVRSDNGFGSMSTWQVVVWLPTALADAERWVDARLTALIAALDAEAVVTSAETVQLQIDKNSAPALVVEVVRETEE